MNLIKKIKLLRYSKNPYFKTYFKEVKGSKLEEITFCCIDTETTGLDPEKDEVISIGGVKIKNLKIDMKTQFYKVVKPAKNLKKENILIHRITPEEIKKAPPIKEVLPEVLSYIKGTVLVGYFIKFDINMLSKYTKKLYGFPILNPYIDLIDLQQELLHKRYTSPEKRKIKTLEEMAQEYNIPVENRHNALYDSLISAFVFLAVIKKHRKLTEKVMKKILDP